METRPRDLNADQRLSQDEVALVLRRAAELDRHVCDDSPGLAPAALEQAAVEAGLSLESVRRAMAELRAGLLEPGPRRRAWLGSPTLTMCRTVPGPASAVEQYLHRFLRGQLFELRRDYGERTTWVRRRGLEATARRVVDRALQRRLVLREACHVDLSVVEEPGTTAPAWPDRNGWVLVRLDVDVLAVRHAQGTIAGLTAVTGGGLAVGGAAGATADPLFLLLSAVGAGVVAVGQWAGRNVYRNRVEEIESALAGMLDRLERDLTRRLR